MKKNRLLAIPSRTRLHRILRYLFDEEEFLSPYGIRSLSKYYAAHPYSFKINSREHKIEYVPGASNTYMFGGNSNWRGPIWFPINFLIIEALERYNFFYGETFKVEFPTGSGNMISLKKASELLTDRLINIFAGPCRPCFGQQTQYADHPNWKELLLFHEYFHAETGMGLGASHQTGWTALIIRLLQEKATR